ncbi:type III secretion system needle length determinant, SpaN/EivJ family [Yersinia hibernica]|uniref:Type III secretion protein n=1 Tax=Yersinia hibernica TaxID=2339259 RepID=A0ABX5R3Z9_9GAMM|nr:type III secretion system needle length determinant, SpaN/EivJ family [Yersinia hibernica]QAX80375.1 type III secretion protein [Yersinia hibernica]
MVAIKQVASSALPDIRKDEAAARPWQAMLRTDSEQTVTSIQQEAQKKMAQLLAKAKQRKKQAEEQLASSAFSPMTQMNSTPLSTRLALPNIAQLPDSKPIQQPNAWGQGFETVEQPQISENKENKENKGAIGDNGQPALPARAAVDSVSRIVAPEGQSRVNIIQSDNSEQPLSPPHNLEMQTAPASSATDGQKEGQFSPAADQNPPSVVESMPLASSESRSELPRLDIKENAFGPEQTLLPIAPQTAVQSPTVTQSEGVKSAPSTFPSAAPESAATEVKSAAEHRTLSYTFTQWKNSPVVTLKLSRAGELTAMTNSVEVQHALQDKHHWLASENSLQFRDEQHDEARREQQHPDQEDETS